MKQPSGPFFEPFSKCQRAVSMSGLYPAVLLMAGLVCLLPGNAGAANGSWTNDASGNWSDVTSWNPNLVPGTTAGDIVSLTNNISAARTVTIDSGAFPLLGTL